MNVKSYLSQFNYQILGSEDKPKLVFLHGLMGGGNNWKRITQDLEQEYHILVFDQRGHGKSFKPHHGYSPKDYSEDLKKILQELGWKKIGLIGHSMGGRNALEFAGLYPQFLWALVLEDIGPEINLDAAQRIRSWIEAVPVPFANKQAARDYFAGPFKEVIKTSEKAKTLGDFFYWNLEEKEDGSMDWKFFKPGILTSLQEGRDHERWRLLREIKVPTLVVRGEHSSDLTPEIFTKMQSMSPLVRGVQIADSGHWIHFEQPQVFIKVLKEFLGGVDKL